MSARPARREATTSARAWIAGEPMDPAATPPEPLPALPGVPFAHRGASVVIVGPTGRGRSSLVQAGLYDAALAGLDGAYLGSEITREEFDARAADLARRRGEAITAKLRAQLAHVRYLDLASVIAHAWGDPAGWLEEVTRRYRIVGIDPLSAVASALGLDFDNNAAYVSFFDRLVQPAATQGVAFLLVDNVGHSEEARSRAKGASAKHDRADVTIACTLTTNPAGLAVKAGKVRSVRAPFRRGDEWIFARDTQLITPRAASATGDTGTERPTFRPTTLMQRVSEVVEQEPGLSATAIRTAVGGRKDYVRLALQLLISEGYVTAEQEGKAHRHHTTRPYRQDADEQQQTSLDEPHGSHGSATGPARVPDPSPGTGSHGSHPRRGDPIPDRPPNGPANGSLTIEAAEALAAEYTEETV
jgi:hypothetical protein